MKLRSTESIVGTALLVSAALGLTACGSNVEAAPAGSSSASAAENAPNKDTQIPTVNVARVVGTNAVDGSVRVDLDLLTDGKEAAEASYSVTFDCTDEGMLRQTADHGSAGANILDNERAKVVCADKVAGATEVVTPGDVVTLSQVRPITAPNGSQDSLFVRLAN